LLRVEVEMLKQASDAQWRRLATLPLRLVVADGFMAHGWAKLNRGQSRFANLLEKIGVPLPEPTAWRPRSSSFSADWQSW
jgi:uncharacterized membrane protein YphA (DoxX/SURF4 family)